ncbi:MAG: type II toxin-antitoxin system RelE family toxin [Brevibacterium aurantiacum]|uniref:type II toxin-antitoxin system RelE family toxin n=1 Tax=Brevibacterium aurantiacum TaxID=273384 RepID=UPI003F90A81F
MAEEPRPQGSIQLKGGDGELRIRVGDDRIIYDVYDGELIVLVLHLGHRREVYR